MPDVLQEIADAAAALTDPHRHSEPRTGWDRNRNRKPLPPHVTTVPGLIEQLREATGPGGAGGDGEGGGSSVEAAIPVTLSALSLLASISLGAVLRARAWQVDLTRRVTPEDHVRALVGAAPRQPSDEQKQLARELCSWVWQAEIVTGWRSRPLELMAPCMRCGARGTLLAYAHEDNPRARCLGCGASWADRPREGEGSIRVLASHVAEYRERAGLSMAQARAAAVEVRRRREGRSVA